MPLRGQVYGPNKNYPPGSPTWHRLVVLAPNIALTNQVRGIHVMAAVIRSRSTARLIPVHSVVIPANTIPAVPMESVIETHQLFALPAKDFTGPPDGALPQDILDEALEGARYLFK